MKFKTVSDSFNYWNNRSMEEIEERAAQIKGMIESDPSADVTTLNIEIQGLQQAKENKQEKDDMGADQQRGFNPITGMRFETRSNVESGDVYGTPEYRSAFLKSLLGRELTQSEKAAYSRAMSERRADTFMGSTDEAAVIPTQTLNEIVKKARTMGGVISACRSFAMPSNIAIPVGTPGTDASWHTEGTEVAGEKLVPVTVTFSGYEIVKVFSLSVKVKNMSINAFESYLVDELTACVMATIDNSLINGTGSGQGTGLLKTAGTTATTYTTGGITYKDIISIIPQLKRGYSAGAAFAMNNTTLYSQIYGLTDGNKRPLFVQDPQNDNVGKILGFPVIIDDYIPDGTIIFGNFSYMGYNLPAGISVDSSEQSSFKKALIDYRGMAIADTKCIVPEAFVIATEAKA